MYCCLNDRLQSCVLQNEYVAIKPYYSYNLGRLEKGMGSHEFFIFCRTSFAFFCNRKVEQRTLQEL